MNKYPILRNRQLRISAGICAASVLMASGFYEFIRPMPGARGAENALSSPTSNCYIESVVAGDSSVATYFAVEDAQPHVQSSNPQAVFRRYGGVDALRVDSQALPEFTAEDGVAFVYAATLTLDGLHQIGTDLATGQKSVVDVDAMVDGRQLPCGGFDIQRDPFGALLTRVGS
ncbi:MAG TPA: hypothetical protein VJP80_02975 [Candidatus Saccharimonadales bacterium]|nr:hypothetical protein [Candidatus Saccharimonadales bacterium]